MTTVLIADSDPIALELLQRQFHAHDSVTCTALDALQAADRIATDCRDCDGLITNLDLGGARTGWELARLVREVHPDIAIGYMSSEGHRDWVAHGVPNSVLLSKALDEAEIATAFLQFCGSSRRASDRRVTATAPASHIQPDPAPTQAPIDSAFAAVDWAATPLGARAQWDGNLQSWVRLMLAMEQPVLIVWGQHRVMLSNAPFRQAFAHVFKDALGAGFVAPRSGDWAQCSALIKRTLADRSGALSNLRLSGQLGAAPDDGVHAVSCTAIQDSSGQALGAICLFTDTTETVRLAERARRERDGLRALLNQAPGFLAFLTGAEHRYTFANAAYLQLVERTELVGQRIIDVFPEIITQGFIDILDRVYRSGEPFIAKGVTVNFRRSDGTVKRAFIDLSYFAIRDATGAITGIFVGGEDSTDHHRAQERIGVLQNELIHVSRVNAMGMMVSTIAHELNQPLTTIHNFTTVARTLVERGGEDAAAIDALRSAADAALRAGEIIRNLRDMTTRREVHRISVALEETLREAAALASLGPCTVQFAFALHGAATVHGDKVLIQQVVFNLVRNAIEAADSESIDITITTADRGPFVEICISDSGPGIDPAVLPTIFDSFVTTKSDGTGIGLSISQAIVEAHGGSIAVRPGTGRGTTFCFTLPHVA